MTTPQIQAIKTAAAIKAGILGGIIPVALMYYLGTATFILAPILWLISSAVIRADILGKAGINPEKL